MSQIDEPVSLLEPRDPPTDRHHSSRSTTVGSIRLALRAGT